MKLNLLIVLFSAVFISGTTSYQNENISIKTYSMTGDFFGPCLSKMIVSYKLNKFNAVAIDCENEYRIFNFYTGTVSQLNISGKCTYIDNCGGGDPAEPMCDKVENFDISITADYGTLKNEKLNFNESKFNFKIIPLNLNVYNQPTNKSQIKFTINSKQELLQLLEIGNVEKKGNKWFVWMKVKSKNNTGWCLGKIAFL